MKHPAIKKLDFKKSRLLKILHLLFAIMWIGGVLALLCIQIFSKPATIEMAYLSAQDQLIIDKCFLIPGGIGIVCTALLYELFTDFGAFRQRWVAVKWILTILLIGIGAGYMGVLVEETASYTAQALATGSINFRVYWHNVHCVAFAGIVQLTCFLLILFLSVCKPKLHR